MERESLFPSPNAPLSVAESRVYGELDALQELVETDALDKDELRAAAWVLIDRVRGLKRDLGRVEAARLEWAAKAEDGTPIPAPPRYLSGDEGETVFVRRDLADTVVAARAWLLAQGENWGESEADEVEMLPVPEHFTEIDWSWAVVREGTADAIAYWRFRV